MKWIGRFGQSLATALSGAKVASAKVKITKRRLAIEITPSFPGAIAYHIGPSWRG
jgi:hypothetical protein